MSWIPMRTEILPHGAEATFFYWRETKTMKFVLEEEQEEKFVVKPGQRLKIDGESYLLVGTSKEMWGLVRPQSGLFYWFCEYGAYWLDPVVLVNFLNAKRASVVAE